ncbi:MAG: FAD:protein FMN transferase [Halanaerobiaceae bacterium]
MEYHGNKNHCRYIRYIVIIILIIIAVFIIRKIRTGLEHNQIISDNRFMMDTMVTIKISVPQGKSEIAQKAINNAFDRMQNLADKMDRFRKGSVVGKVNNAGGDPVIIDKETFKLLGSVKEYATISSGIFDPTIAPLIDSWGFGTDKKQIPSSEEINEILKKVDYRKIKLTREDDKFYVKLPAEMAIDLGGAVKGYIVDSGIESIRSRGIDRVYINAGGNIRVAGNKTGGKPWQIGVKQPRGQGIISDYIFQLDRGSIATSGDYERYFIREGIKYSHLLDPRTGYPVREMYSATVYAETALEADVLSTTVFIAGWDRGREIINQMQGVEGLLVRKGELWVSEGVRRLIKKQHTN